MPDIIYHNAASAAFKKLLDIDNDTLMAVLLDSGYTPNPDHAVYSDISGDELATANGYTAGGVAVAGTVTDDDATDRAIIDIADPSWTAAGGAIGPADYCGIYDDTATLKELLYLVEFASSQIANDGAVFKVTIDTNGLFYIDQP